MYSRITPIITSWCQAPCWTHKFHCAHLTSSHDKGWNERPRTPSCQHSAWRVRSSLVNVTNQSFAHLMGLQITTKREKWIRAKKRRTENGKSYKGKNLVTYGCCFLLAIMNYFLGNFFTLSLSVSLYLPLVLIENIRVECETMLKDERMSFRAE